MDRPIERALVGNSDLQLSRRKTRDKSFALLILGVVLLMPPIVRTSLFEGNIFGIPYTIFYMFAVWAFLIVGAAIISPRLRDSDKSLQSNTTRELVE